MERIKSFQINHNILEPGFYISREDDNVITYDLRTRKPNNGDYMSNATMHSLEHMFATYARNSAVSDKVIYFGPMGCQTGFYFLVKDLAPVEVFELTIEILEDIVAYEGPVFGASAIECGNYANLDLELAKEEAAKYLEVLNNWENMQFSYPE
ncbi:MAG: S-ribosylhomocysteine lyase [Agathobacter sp.]|nr:S-ribosylhomocysteine lyase [Agathobacter sp.]